MPIGAVYSPHQTQFFAWELTRRARADSVESLGATLVDAQVDLNLQKTALSLQQREQGLQQQLGQIKAVRTLRDNHAKAVVESQRLEQQAQRLKRASDVVRETRIKFIDDILESVATETNRLYGLIHPNEPIALSKLELDKARRASLVQLSQGSETSGANATTKRPIQRLRERASAPLVFESILSHFEGVDDVPPQAYFSESHLDTQAFCFWLAVAKRERPSKDAVLALDQLVQSIVREPFERQHVAQEAGILLEAILDHLALTYRCRVPRTTTSDYTLSELLNGTSTLFKKLALTL